MKKFSLPLATVGMFLCSVGAFLQASSLQKYFFLIGSIFMFFAACIDGQVYFQAISGVATIGSLLAFVEISNQGRVFLVLIPVLLSIFILIKKNAVSSIRQYLGLGGIVFLASGYATLYAPFFIGGSSILMSFSLWTFFAEGNALSLYWAALNAVFVVAGILGVV